MDQENMTENFGQLHDDMLEQVSGGYLQVSQWREYTTQNIFPLLLAHRSTADASDGQIIDRIYGVIQATLIPGASVAAPVYSLRVEYNSSLRINVHSDSVRQDLDKALNLACSYLDAHV